MVYNDLLELPLKHYKIIYADPPWFYADKSYSHGGGAEAHYPCMRTDSICNLPVKDVAADDSILFLWVTYPQLKEGISVVESWGFDYKTVAFTWIKLTQASIPAMGMGRYTRSNPEILLLGRRGKGAQRLRKDIMNVQFHKRLAHSQKPDLFRRLIVNLFGDLPRIELFAREQTNGWDAWGNEILREYQLEMEIIDTPYKGRWPVSGRKGDD